MKILVFFALIAFAASQPEPEHCCSAEEFEGHREFWRGFLDSDGKPDIELGWGRIHYNYILKRLAFAFETVRENSQERREFRVIDRFDEEKRYMIEGEQCQVSDLSEMMRHPCVPDNLYHGGRFVLGHGRESLRIDEWIDRNEEGEFKFLTSEEGCYPIGSQEAFIGEHEAFLMFISDNRYTIGIEDEDVFTPPSSCNSVKQIDLPETFKLYEKIYLA